MFYFHKIKTVILIFILSLSWNPCLFAAEGGGVLSEGRTYSLSDLYGIALKTSEEIRISEKSLSIAEITKEKAFSVLIPGVYAFGDYTRYTEKKSFDDALFQPEWAVSYGLKASQSFTLNGKELTAFRMAENNIEKNKYDLFSVKEDYLFRLASAYYDVLKSMKAVEIAQANVERLEKHRQSVSARLRLEEVAKTALYRAEAELSQSRTGLISAKNNLKLAKTVLSRIVGLPGLYEIREPGAKEHFLADTDLEALKAEALANRAEIKSLQMQEKVSDNMVEISRGAYWPAVSVEGTYLKMDQDPSSPHKDSMSLGLKLSFSLFDGGLREAGVRESLEQKEQVRLSLENLSKQIAVQIEQVYLELMTHQSILKSLADQLEFAKENYNAVTKQFQYGLADSVDVMDANTLLVTSEKQLSESGYGFQLAFLKLERAKGTFLKKILENKE